MVQEFSDKFISRHGTMNCKELINCDLRTEEGRRYARDNNIYAKICEKCVSDSVKIISELLATTRI
jgi:hypothetical protein